MRPDDHNLWSPSSAIAWDKPAPSNRPFRWSTTAQEPPKAAGSCLPRSFRESASRVVCWHRGQRDLRRGPSFRTTPPARRCSPWISVRSPAPEPSSRTPSTTCASSRRRRRDVRRAALAPVMLTYQPPSTATLGCPPAGCITPPKPAPPLAHISTQITAFQRLTGPSATPPSGLAGTSLPGRRSATAHRPGATTASGGS